MNEKMKFLKVNQTWILVPKPKNQKPMSCKWIYIVKEGQSSDEPYWYKARLVAKGITQKEDVYYTEFFCMLLSIRPLWLCYLFFLVLILK